MSLGKPIVFEVVTYHDEKAVELYHELVNRHDHLREALALYSKFAEKHTNDHIAISNYLTVRESLMWFLTVEFYSRFLSDHKSRNGSKRCIKKLLEVIGDAKITKKYGSFITDETAVVHYLKTQRNKYFAHADEVDWEHFPRVFDDEYERALDRIADVLELVREVIGTQRTCARSAKVANVFD